MPTPRLVHVDDSLPGISRTRSGVGWLYRDAKGKIIRDRDEIDRLNAIALPPAYEDAWFCPAPNGHILATGYDARGRKQYRYHPDFRMAREADKYDRCAAFGHALPLLRARLVDDLNRRTLCSERVVAAVVRLLDLAAQGIFSDLFASLSIIFDRPFRVGETIKYDTSTATVERIGLKSTRLRSLNGELLVISNTNLLSKEITNFAHLHRRRITFKIGVIYQTTPEMLRDLPALLEEQVTAAGHEFIRSSFLSFGASSLDFELLFDVFSDQFDEVAAARTEVGIRLFDAMTRGGYGFAYPTQTSFTAAPDGTMIMPYPESPKPRAAATKAAKPA